MHIIIICSDLRVWPRSWRQHQHLPATWPGILLLFLLLLLLLLLLSLNQKVDSNIRYNGNGYLPCNGFVPCQVITLFTHLSAVSLSKDVKPKSKSQSPVIINPQAPGNSLTEGYQPKSYGLWHKAACTLNTQLAFVAWTIRFYGESSPTFWFQYFFNGLSTHAISDFKFCFSLPSCRPGSLRSGWRMLGLVTTTGVTEQSPRGAGDWWKQIMWPEYWSLIGPQVMEPSP